MPAPPPISASVPGRRRPPLTVSLPRSKRAPFPMPTSATSPTTCRPAAGWQTATVTSSGTPGTGTTIAAARRRKWQAGAGSLSMIQTASQQLWRAGQRQSQSPSHSRWCFRCAVPTTCFGRSQRGGNRFVMPAARQRAGTAPTPRSLTRLRRRCRRRPARRQPQHPRRHGREHGAARSGFSRAGCQSGSLAA